jgi:two-component system, chemotaxis family, sensor kinase CheA
MTIRQLIVLLIVLSIGALGVGGGVAAFLSRGSAAEVKAVTEGVVPSSLASVELMSQLKDVQIATLSMVSAPDADAVAKAAQDLADRKVLLQKALRLQFAQADSNAQRGLITQAEESLVNYFASIDDTAKYKIAGQKDMAEALLGATVDQYLREQMSIIETIQVEKRRSKDEAILRMNDNLRDTFRTLLTITLASVALMGGVGVMLYRRIIRPINDMQAKMTDIATTQDFSHRVPVMRSDEIGKSIVAFNTMIEKIQESSELVKQKTADIQAMLHYIPQGILTILPGNTVHPEYSAYLETILETQEIGGQDLMKLVFSHTDCNADVLSQIEVTSAACIGEDVMNFEFNAHLLVKEIQKTMPDGRLKIFDLTWSPITDESDTTLRLMLSLRDVTELRALAAEASEQKRELAIIGEILAVHQEKFHAFVDSAKKLIAENRCLIEQAGEQGSSFKDPAQVNVLFRNMHTVKGNARTYGLLHLTHVFHDAEQSYDVLRKNAEAPVSREQLLAELDTASAFLEEYEHINEVKLGRKEPGRRGGVDKFLMVQRDHIQRDMDLLKHVDETSLPALRNVVVRLRNSLQLIGTERIQDVLASVLDSVPSLAKELGKEVPQLVVNDHNIMVKTQVADLLKNVFMHLYRNAMDHGIESAEKRLAQAKLPAGRITLDLSLDDEVFTLRLRDDGRGLALDVIRAKAIDSQLMDAEQPISAYAIAQLIFHPGLSTAQSVTAVSGRGVGMDAVKGFIESQGGSISLNLLPDNGDAEHRQFETLICLPGEFAVKAMVLTDISLVV